MRTFAALLFLFLSSPFLSNTALAVSNNIPLEEQAFVEKIPWLNKAIILDQLGEPSDVINVRNQDTGELVGAIWHYHYLNPSDNGDYYKTTELDFVDDKVVTIVFSNADFEDSDASMGTPTEKMTECPQTC